MSISNETVNDKNKQDIQTMYSYYGMYFLIYSVILITTVLYFIYSDNSLTFSYSTLGFVVSTFFLLGISIFYYYPQLKNKNTNMTLTYLMAILICLVSGISFVGLTVSNENLALLGNVFLIFIVLVTAIALAIFFYIFGDYLKQQRGFLGLLINFIFFIPCLILDFVEFMKTEFSLTTRTEYILVIVELLLIISYFFAKPIIDNLLSSGTVYLLNNPVFLNKKTIIMDDTTTLMSKPDPKAPLSTDPVQQLINKKKYNSNFSISMWVYLNVQTGEFLMDNGNSYESNIFSYGNGKPKITYTNNPTDRSNRDVYNFYFSDSLPNTQPHYKTTIASQKWNNIVFNYSSSKVDLFINGNLETTFYFGTKADIPIYNEDDYITVGQQINGLFGAICNIVYTKNLLLNTQIVNNYNVLMLKNPPTLQI